MAALTEQVSFAGLCELKDVQFTGQELGHGAYAQVLELEYMGMKCAGKKIHDALLGETYAVRRFEGECHLLSEIRHPNIVQFLGITYREGVQVPILVMEYLPHCLTSCIEQHGVLPKETYYSILHDVALGLCYLHCQPTPIIHRDLSANNVLLTSSMTAKISDLGVARSMTTYNMTETPGTPAYMPPEVMVFNPTYDISVDQFSYGILMIHVLSGKWPAPQIGQTHIDPKSKKLVPVSEAERRQSFIDMIGHNHPLMDLILKCIDNDPQHRAHASEIVKRLSPLVPVGVTNYVELIRQVEIDQKEKKLLEEALEIRKQTKPFFTWKKCADIPRETMEGNAIIIDGNVFYGGGGYSSKDDIVSCYNPKQNEWNDLPGLGIKFFGLGQITGKLVAVGGKEIGGKKNIVGEVNMFNQQKQKWEKSFQPMPTARCSHGILSLENFLIAVGGIIAMDTYTGTKDEDSCNIVEIFKIEESQWYRTSSLPIESIINMSIVNHRNMCYVVGGYNDSKYLLNNVYCAEIGDLLRNIVPTTMQSKAKNCTTPVWKVLPSSPNYQPTALVIGDNLFSMGGSSSQMSKYKVDYETRVYMYSAANNSWIFVDYLPAPLILHVVAALSPTKLLLIGGESIGETKTKAVYKGRVWYLMNKPV